MCFCCVYSLFILIPSTYIKMPTSCAAYGCNNNNAKEYCKEKNISFHRIPIEDKALLKKWLIKMKRRDFEPTYASRLCSEHFEENCFTYQPFTNKRTIKKDAIPTKFVFTKKQKSRKRTSYTVGSPIRNEDDTDEAVMDHSSHSISFSSVFSSNADEENDEGDEESDDDIAMAPSTSSTSIQTEVGFSYLIDELAEKNKIIDEMKAEIETLKKEGSLCPSDMTDEQLKNFSGFDKHTFFQIYEFLNLEEDLLTKKPSKLTPLRQFFLFMCRLRQGFTLDTLAYFFKISETTASRTVNNLATIIYDKLQGVPIWPKREQVNEFMPASFKIKYPNCRIIIDCTEFEVQKPESPLEQQLTFSSYKNTNTAKALVGIAPSGGISFISDLWCGSVSDKYIFCHSEILQLLERGDAVLADKGFTIAKELESIGAKLVQPLFLTDKIQFNLEERVFNKGVSNLRVHIERAIARIKYFKFFEGAIPYSCFHNLHQIFYIATFLTNFRPPLINMRIMELDNTEEQASIKNMRAAGPSCEHSLRDPGPRVTGGDEDSEKENEDIAANI